MSKRTEHSITVKNKKYRYSLEPKRGGITRVICKDAKIDQDFLNEDVPALLSDLPELIIAEQEYKKSQSTVVQFRLKLEEKRRLEQIAIKRGFSNLSAYLRSLALANNK